MAMSSSINPFLNLTRVESQRSSIVTKRTRKRVLSTALQRSLEAGAVTISAEVMPPRGADPSHALSMAMGLKDRVHAINVTDGSRAVMRMSSLALCRLLLDGFPVF